MPIDRKFDCVPTELYMDPHSPFMKLNEVSDDYGDPLELLIALEEGDEIAQEIVSCQQYQVDRRSESRPRLTPNVIIQASAKLLLVK